MSQFLDALREAARGSAGLTTGEPGTPVRHTWAQVHQQARAGAAGLTGHGVRPGDAVAVLAGFPADVAPIAQAVWLAGGSMTMLHQPTARTAASPQARRRWLTHTLATLAVVGARLVVVATPFEAAIIALRSAGVDVVTAAELAAGDPAAAVEAVRAEDDAALLQLTSGSTGTPKAVRITDGNLWASLESMCAAADIRGGRDVMVSWLPLFHDMGMVGFLTLPMSRGVEVVAVTPADFLANPLLWPELISRYGGTHTAAPNFAYAVTARLLPRASGLDLSTLRFALNGAEPIDVRAARAFLAAGRPFGLPETAMVCAYGMAEATLGVSFHPWGTPLQVDVLDAAALEHERRAVPATGGDTRAFPVLGPPLPGLEVQVRGEDGHVCGEREIGVLHVRGDAVTELYLTEQGPVPTRDSGGWLDTGDLGYLTDGRVVVCGRVKDVIIMGGRNIWPTDIERAAETVPGVRAGNAVAVRFSEPERRESFGVIVESRAAGDPEAARRITAEVRSVVTGELGVRPGRVLVVPVGTLPKTPSGKHQRHGAAQLLADTPP